MIIFKPIGWIIPMLFWGFITYLLIKISIDPIISIFGSFFLCVFILIKRANYYKNINHDLVEKYIQEYKGEETAIRYFKKTIYAKKNNLANKKIIYNDEFKQMPKFLLAKKLPKRVSKRISNNYIKVHFNAPHVYKDICVVNLVLITNVKANVFNDYIAAIKEEHIDEEIENIVLFYLENPSNEELQIIKRKMNVNNYIIDGISTKVSFLISDDNGFKLYDNYYFIDYSTDMIKDKYRIKSNVPIPSDELTKKVNFEIYTRLCGV
jgi:hypothetical protein